MGYRSEVVLVVGKEVMPQFMVTMARMTPMKKSEPSKILWTGVILKTLTWMATPTQLWISSVSFAWVKTLKMLSSAGWASGTLA